MTVWRLLRRTYQQWRLNNASLLAAGLAYFTVFSLAPLLILLIALTGMLFGEAAAQGKVIEQIGLLVGPEAARFVETLVRNARESGMGTASLLSAAMLILGSSGMFGQLQRALNVIWGVHPESAGFLGFVKNRLLLLTLLIFVGLLMLVFFSVNAGLGAAEEFFERLPVLRHVAFWRVMNFTLAFVLLSLFSAGIFRVLPSARIEWRDVWVGGVVTSLMLSAGMLLIGLYFSYSNFQSIYGVAGSVIAIFLWIYFSAQIFLFGAEFAWVYTAHRHEKAGKAPPRRRHNETIP